MKKIFIAAAVLFLVLSIGARSTFAAENIFQRTFNSIGNSVQRFYLRWIPGSKPGDAVMRQALAAMQEVKTAQVSSEIGGDLLHDDQPQGSFKVTVTGPAQLQPKTGEEQSKQELSLTGDFTLQGTTLHMAADTKVVGNTFYFKLNQVPALPNVDLSSITGKWYKTTSETATGSAQTLTAEQKAQLQDAMNKLWSSAKASESRPDTLDGHDVFIVDVVFPRTAIQEYLNTAVSIQSSTNPDQSPDVTSRIQEVLQKNSDRVGDVSGKLWIDRSSFYLRQLSMPIVYNMPAQESETTSFAPLAALSHVNKVNLLIKAHFDNFDEPIQFVEPTDALDAKEAFAASFGKMMTPGMTSSEGTSELPTLTPAQRLQLQQLNSISPAQKQKFLDQLNTIEKMKSTEPAPAP